MNLQKAMSRHRTQRSQRTSDSCNKLQTYLQSVVETMVISLFSFISLCSFAAKLPFLE
jgi:hypothetical protein